MTVRAEPRRRDETTDPTTLDDEAFWALAAEWGFVRPQQIDPDQAWFWTRAWITGEIEASRDIAAGRIISYSSDDEFLSSLARAAHDEEYLASLIDAARNADA